MHLISQHCVPCEGGTPPMNLEQAHDLLAQVPRWELLDGEPLKIHRSWKFKDFVEAMEFVNKVSEIAEAENHHPNISIAYNRVRLELWTHAVKGLTVNDFILAAKINELQ
jgi:4a-hydroxytetrahydrobiopterin dehydratase